jgi:hypothetical protein
MLGAMARVAPARPAKLTNGQRQQFSYLCRLGLGIYLFKKKGTGRRTRRRQPVSQSVKSSQVNTLPKAKSETRSKQNKDMQNSAVCIASGECPSRF